MVCPPATSTRRGRRTPCATTAPTGPTSPPGVPLPGHTFLPADPATLTGCLTALAARGLKVGTISRRLSAITFAHTVHDLPDPIIGARVLAVWEGIRRTHTTAATQALPLMPPQLYDVLDACPVTQTWTTPGRNPEPDLAGLRDRALLLVGFVTALRRSELGEVSRSVG